MVRAPRPDRPGPAGAPPPGAGGGPERRGGANGDGRRSRYRSVFISDLHLGSRRAQADSLLAFLRRVECDFLYLVGDLVDSWGPERMDAWPPSHVHVLEEVRSKATGGTRVLCLPGNHDVHFHREWVATQAELGSAPEHEHETADGRRLWVVHGHEFDVVVRRWTWLGHVGDFLSLGLETGLGLLDVFLPPARQGTLSRGLKRLLKRGLGYVASFERSAVEVTRGRSYDGVVCGHVHVPRIEEFGGVHYHNDGDWVESCTALVEHADGRFELLECRLAGLDGTSVA